MSVKGASGKSASKYCTKPILAGACRSRSATSSRPEIARCARSCLLDTPGADPSPSERAATTKSCIAKATRGGGSHGGCVGIGAFTSSTIATPPASQTAKAADRSALRCAAQSNATTPARERRTSVATPAASQVPHAAGSRATAVGALHWRLPEPTPAPAKPISRPRKVERNKTTSSPGERSALPRRSCSQRRYTTLEVRCIQLRTTAAPMSGSGSAPRGALPTGVLVGLPPKAVTSASASLYDSSAISTSSEAVSQGLPKGRRLIAETTAWTR